MNKKSNNETMKIPNVSDYFLYKKFDKKSIFTNKTFFCAFYKHKIKKLKNLPNIPDAKRSM